MTEYFLGADLGGTKTHVLISNEHGQALGFGEGGPGNHESVGYAAFQHNLQQAVNTALHMANVTASAINGAGYGVAGYDWPIEEKPTLDIIGTLQLSGAVGLVNDTELGLLAGSPRMWGIAVVSGTGCNCRGWDESRTHFGRVTGGGVEFGENAGASELMVHTGQVLANAWTGRGPATALAEAFCRRYQVKDLGELLQGCICRTIELRAVDAPLVFEVARQGDPVANEIIRWAGAELGEMVCTVIRQLHFEPVDFDLVQIGSMWEGSPVLTTEMGQRVHAIAPHARLIRTHEPPVLGAVLLGMQSAGLRPSPEVRANLIQSLGTILAK
jgi:N-acetylglucosamine kinase-like BadF-type ATPase